MISELSERTLEIRDKRRHFLMVLRGPERAIVRSQTVPEFVCEVCMLTPCQCPIAFP